MPSKKKPFIDKKNSISFHVVHRSQRDPLQASDAAPSRVLVPATDARDNCTKGGKKLEEQRKFGVFYDDEYDYMQHLYDLDEVQPVAIEEVIGDVVIKATGDSDKATDQTQTTLQLPSSVFASTLETNVGLLNKAVAVKGPQPDWDPDIVAAMDDDFNMDDPDNVLDDHFISFANTDAVERDEGCYDSEGDDEGSDVDSMAGGATDSDDGSGERLFMTEETRSRFTEYSMTSSVMHRNDGLVLLDDRFEKFYEGYDDSEIGALDHDDIDGCLTQNDPLIQHVIEEFESELKKREQEGVIEGGGEVPEVGDSGAESDESLEKMVVEEVDPQWDCESILSTYSNLYNHPRLIEEPSTRKIELTSRVGIPRDTLPACGLTRAQIEKEIRESRQVDRASTNRARGETTDERKARKVAIRSERKERRIEKKSNKMAFKEEEQKQQKQRINVITNIQGVKIT